MVLRIALADFAPMPAESSRRTSRVDCARAEVGRYSRGSRTPLARTPLSGPRPCSTRSASSPGEAPGRTAQTAPESPVTPAGPVARFCSARWHRQHIVQVDDPVGRPAPLPHGHARRFATPAPLCFMSVVSDPSPRRGGGAAQRRMERLGPQPMSVLLASTAPQHQHARLSERRVQRREDSEACSRPHCRLHWFSTQPARHHGHCLSPRRCAAIPPRLGAETSSSCSWV